jgi:glycosyltransferase involved in cell wall biosynthesis
VKIMQIVSGTRISGAITYCLGLMQELVKRQHQVTLVCKPGAWIGKQVASLPIEVVHSDLHRLPWDELRRMAGLAQQRQIDVVQTHASSAHSFGVLLRLFWGIPCVATAHSRKIQLHWCMNDFVIACSDATQRFHRLWNRVPASRLATVHGFIDPGPFLAVSQEQRSATRRSLGVGPDTPLVGIVAKLGPRKGQIDVVRALPRLLADHPELKVVFVGDATVHSAYVAEVSDLARQLGVASALIWTGVRRDIPQLMSAFDVFACPSLEETLPLVVLEAMAAGRPVVASLVGGLGECILPGVTGALVPPANPSVLADALLHLLQDTTRREQYGAAGRQRILDHFSNDAIVPQIEAILEQVAGRRRQPTRSRSNAARPTSLTADIGLGKSCVASRTAAS